MPEEIEYLSLSEVLKRINRTETKDRSAMNRYLDNPEIAQLLGATGGERTRKYPSSNLWIFAEIAKKNASGELAPKYGVEFVRRHLDSGAPIEAFFVVDEEGHTEASDDRSTDQSDNRSNALVPAPLVGQAMQLTDLVVDRLIERVRAAEILPQIQAPKDRLLTRDQVAEILGLTDKPHIVARRIPPVLPHRWSEIHVNNYLAGLRAAAEAKAETKKNTRRSKK